MKLKQETPDILVSDNFKQTNFSIDESSLHIIFDVLRSKVYKNPIGSLCREVASNSRDAQREAGDFTTPTEIEIADGRGDFFYIDGLNIIFRDFGVGLSPDRMDNVYAKYGASTKRNSNALTGGFGLGAKTPFAYCDAFTVRTIVDKVEYVYSVYIDESREGKIALLTEQPFEREGNLTEIIVPLKEKDRDTFEKEVIRNTHFWPIRPTLINFEEEYEEIELANLKVDGLKMEIPGEYRIVKKGYSFIESNINVIIDGIYYPVDSALLGYKFGYENWALVFDFNNGDLTISANREQLQYDDETIAKIKTKVDDMLALLQLSYDQMLTSQKTVFHARITMNNMRRNDDMFDFLKKNTKFFYTLPNGNQVELNDSTSFRPNTFRVYSITQNKHSDNFRIDKDQIHDLYSARVMEHFDNLFIITKEQAADQKFKLLNSINRTLINRAADQRFVLFVEMSEDEFKNYTYRGTFQAENDKDWEVLREIGFNFNNYWDVVPDKAPVGVRVKKETITLKTFEAGRFNRENFYFQNGYFLDYKGQNITDFLFFHSDYEKEIKNDSDLALQLEKVSEVVYKIDKTKKIVVSSALKAKYFTNYVSVETWLATKQDEINKLYERQKVDSHTWNAKNYLKLGFDKEITDELTYIVGISKLDYTDLSRFTKFLQERMPTFTLTKREFNSVFKKIYEEYPLLNNVDDNKLAQYVKMEQELRELRKFKEAIEIQNTQTLTTTTAYGI